uniref:Tc1-like transposase DDE domain-containing protein n=1 Tax=Ditylenchus dipsaci TaxID=166011 RepID=A0A915ESG1_9BILA
MGESHTIALTPHYGPTDGSHLIDSHAEFVIVQRGEACPLDSDPLTYWQKMSCVFRSSLRPLLVSVGAMRQTLLRRFQRGSHKSIVFSDEKLFVVEEKFNKQNVRIIAKDIGQASAKGRIVGRIAHPKSVMVWVGNVYWKDSSGVRRRRRQSEWSQLSLKILEEALLPWARRHFRRRHWCFQQVFFQFLSFISFQDSAPAHKARETQAWCRNDLPEFIDVKQWPPYSPDLNPLDDSIWGILEAKVNNRRHREIAQLKTALQEAWEEIDDELLASW